MTETVENELPSLAASDRPRYAYTVWEHLILSGPDRVPEITLGRGLERYSLAISVEALDRLDDPGIILDISLAETITQLWPELGPAQSYDPTNALSRHSFTFQQKLNQYLKSTLNAVCLQRGNPHHASVWWVRSEWYDGTPVKIMTSKREPTAAADDPEQQVLLLRKENQRQRARITELERQVHILTRSMRALSD